MDKFFCGVIEGFYGRQWLWQSRLDYAPFLAAHDFSEYIFAPKGEASLRSQWAEPFSLELIKNFTRLDESYRQHNVRWGVGLSPVGLQENPRPAEIIKLKNKVRAINELGADTLCLLFDDMPGALSCLAERQLAILSEALSVSRARRHIICPSYYSFDPVLEQVFGAMPEGYLETLGKGLPAGVEYFWAGNQVISQSYSEQDLQAITQLMGRKPILWDNYPVNDGKRTSPYLHLRAYTGRPFQLKEWSAGHCVNPMNQAALSMPVLASLSELYRNRQAYRPEQALKKALSQLCEPTLAQRLVADIPLFQDQGLDQLSEQQRAELKAFYASCQHPVAEEVWAWLDGAYVFDPACLTG
jgi:hypothetical protein